MGEILDSDWSRQNLLRSDWSGPNVALYTTLRVMCLWPSQTIKRSSSVVQIIMQMSPRRLLYDRSLETGGFEVLMARI